jgi:parvulin-like peptidyl-prolyl isomerase
MGLTASVLFALWIGINSCKKKSDAPPKAPAPLKTEEVREPKVLAVVNGTAITDEEVNFYLMRGKGQATTPELQQETLGKVIDAELLYQKGVELGMDKDPRYQQVLRLLELRNKATRRNELMRRIFKEEIADKVMLEDDAAKEYYEDNKKELSTEYHLLMLRFEHLADAEQALEELNKKKTTFEKLAEKQFRGAKKPDGKPVWDLGFLNWRQMPEEWTKAVFALDPGKYSEPIATHRSGYRVLKLVAKREGAAVSFEKVKATIENRLKANATLLAREEYAKKLRSDAKIEFR